MKFKFVQSVVCAASLLAAAGAHAVVSSATTQAGTFTGPGAVEAGFGASSVVNNLTSVTGGSFVGVASTYRDQVNTSLASGTNFQFTNDVVAVYGIWNLWLNDLDSSTVNSLQVKFYNNGADVGTGMLSLADLGAVPYDDYVGIPFGKGFKSTLAFDQMIVYSLNDTGGAGYPTETYSVSGLQYQLAPVPEPETYAMMLAGLGALGFMARRRRIG